MLNLGYIEMITHGSILLATMILYLFSLKNNYKIFTGIKNTELLKIIRIPQPDFFSLNEMQ